MVLRARLTTSSSLWLLINTCMKLGILPLGAILLLGKEEP